MSLLSSPGASGPAAARGGSVVDDLDDPNSEAPLPEDPNAPSIDDFQGGAAGRAGQGAAALPTGATLPPLSAADGVTDQVTSGFGRRVHPITGDHRFHSGIDLRAAEGAPIHAAAGGVVRDAGRRGGYGKTVEIDHGDGTSTLYAHASQLLVEKGQRVEAGQPLALVGQTGQATGPHLHFELRRHDHPVNPTSGNLPIPTARALNRSANAPKLPLQALRRVSAMEKSHESHRRQNGGRPRKGETDRGQAPEVGGPKDRVSVQASKEAEASIEVARKAASGKRAARLERLEVEVRSGGYRPDPGRVAEQNSGRRRDRRPHGRVVETLRGRMNNLERAISTTEEIETRSPPRFTSPGTSGC